MPGDMVRPMTITVQQVVRNFLWEDEGATSIEYALLASLIALAVLGGTQALSKTIETMYVTKVGQIGTAMSGS